MASPPGSSRISTGTLRSGLKPFRGWGEQSQKADIQVVRWEPTQRTIGVRARDFQGFQPGSNDPFVGRLRAGATTSV